MMSHVWVPRRATASNLTKPQTFSLEELHVSNSGLSFTLVFWVSLYMTQA